MAGWHDIAEWLRRAKARHPRAAVGVYVAFLVGTILLIWFGPSIQRSLSDTVAGWRVAKIEALIDDRAAAAGLDAELVRRVVRAESGGDPRAESPRGARGLMQVTDITLRDVRQRNPDLPRGDLFDAGYNLTVGTTYLAYLMDRFDGDVTLAVTAYHMGPTRVRRVQRANPGITPTQLVTRHAGPQTRAYVGKVLRGYEGPASR
ncbi:MAG: lytic transglycosylase domain-containing protein [Planctomycetota bacterium]